MDIYEVITERIISELEQGIIPWHQPWTGLRTGAISRVTGRAYSLLNQMLLGKPGEYLTFNQCKAEGGKVKKSSKAKTVVFWKVVEREQTGKDGKPVMKDDGGIAMDAIPLLKHFQVFHIEDCEGIEPKWSDDELLRPLDPIKEAETVIADYIKRSGVTLNHARQNRAYYSQSRDTISLPLREQFNAAEGYYEILYPEAVHSTGHKSRLNRFAEKGGIAAFGDESYSKEELVAEIGSSVSLNILGIETPASFRNNVGTSKVGSEPSRMIRGSL